MAVQNSDFVASILADCGESVTYRNVSGTTRSITAYVVRTAASQLGDVDALSPRMEVWVTNSATTGIGRTEINTGGDTISLPIKTGGTATYRPITAILAEDEDMLRLEVR